MTGIIILAAGASTRMGQPKQELQFQGETLLQRAIRIAGESSAQSITVVLGANAEGINAAMDDQRISVCYNAHWQEGMSSSIKAGLQWLLHARPVMEQVLLMLCDQPLVTPQLLNQLMRAGQQQAGIVACAYQDTVGAPVLFHRRYFNQLLLLTGQEGAKKLLMKFSGAVVTIPFKEGAVDVDTPEDYRRLNTMQNPGTAASQPD